MKRFKPRPLQQVAPPLVPRNRKTIFEKTRPNGKLVFIRCVPRLYIIMAKEQWCLRKETADSVGHRHTRPMLYQRAADAHNTCKMLNDLFGEGRDPNDPPIFVVHRLTMSAPIDIDRALQWDAWKHRQRYAEQKQLAKERKQTRIRNRLAPDYFRIK